MEFEKSEQLFSKRGEESVNVYKYFNITSLKRDQKQFFAYMKDYLGGSHQYVRHIATKPPNRLILEYEKIREEVARELRITNAGLIETGESVEEPGVVGGGRKVSAATQAKREQEVQKVTLIDQLVAEGKAVKAACDMVGVPRPRYRSLKKGDIKWFEEWRGGGGSGYGEP